MSANIGERGMRPSTVPRWASAMLIGLLLSAQASPRALQDVLNDGTLRVGVALATPWTLRDRSGELIGFEVDVARRLAEDMGVEAELRVYPWERLIPALESGEIDIIAAGLTVTPQRALHVNFSSPYSSGGVTLATNVERTAGLERLEELDQPAYRLAAVEGSVAAALAGRVLPRAELVLFEDAAQASDALLEGDVDGYLEELPAPTYLALDHPQRIDVPLSQPLLRAPAAFAVAKGDPDFLAFLDAWITARSADTWLPSTHAYWFESVRWRGRVEER